jgi:hypothetical protein
MGDNSALYPSIPLDWVYLKCRGILEDLKNFMALAKYTINFIMDLLEWVLKNNYNLQ